MDNGEAAAVRATIQMFYTAFDDGFVAPADYATEDWNHINPRGGWDRSRDETLVTVRAVHQTFLKNVTDTVESMDVRFAAADVAIGTVVSTMSPFAPLAGQPRHPQRQIRTFVVVRRDGQWLIMQDHNTTVAEPA